MISSLPQQSGSPLAATSSGVTNKSPPKAFSCSSSGYSSQSLSECDLNSNKNKPLDTLSSNSTPTSSQSGSTNQIDKINPSVLLLESTNSLSCIRTSTPTNPINSTTLDNNVYKSLSSECCYSDTLSSHYSSNPSGLPIPHHTNQQQSNLISPTSQCSIDYYRQISFNPTCNSSSLCQSKNYYYVNNVKCYGDQFIETQAPFSLISPINNLINQNKNKYRSNPASFISTSTKTSIPVIKQESINHHRPQMISQPFVRQALPKIAQPRLVEEDEEKKPSKLTLVLTFIIKLFNCFNIFSLFKSNKSKSTNSNTSAQLSNQQSIENVFTSSTSLPLSSESTSSIPKIMLKNKKNSTRTNDLVCKLYAQSVMNEPEKNQHKQMSGIESPSSFNFVGFASNCVSSTPIVQQQQSQTQLNVVKSKEPVVKIKTSKMNIAAIESQLASSYCLNTYNTNSNITNNSSTTSNIATISTNIPIHIEKETYDNLPELDEQQEEAKMQKHNSFLSRKSSKRHQVPAFPTNLVTNISDEVEHYVKINTLSLNPKREDENENEEDDSDANSTNYDNDLEQIGNNQEIYSSSSPASSHLSSSSSLVNSVNIYLSNFNKTGQTTSNMSSSSASVSNSSSVSFNNKNLNLSNKNKTVQFNKVSDFIVESTNRANYTHLNKHTSIRSRNNLVPFYEDYLCDKEVESYFDNPVYYDCYKQKQQQQTKLKQFNSNGVSITSHKSYMINNDYNKIVATQMRNCTIMMNGNTNNSIGSGLSVFKTHMNGNLSGIIRQSNNGESYC